ncbi:MAG TPA: HAMP domain-containing sensor histidine kinase, partial [Hyphomonadaceae bacterium]|nr:HAMP domain-containing sensor histidine kinase [Hyphomonadaceae bacterium]
PAATRTSFLAGLRGRLLIMTALFVLIAELLIYPALAGIYRNGWLEGRAQAAQIAALAVEAAPDGRVGDELSRQLLAQSQVVSVAVQARDFREMVLAPSLDLAGSEIITIDLRKQSILDPVFGAFSNMFAPNDRFLRVIVTPSLTKDVEMEVIVPEAALKAGLLGFSRTLLVVSLIVSAVVGALVYFAVYRLVVKPMQGLTRSIVRFAEAPEGAEVPLPTGGATDEIQRANAALQSMQQKVSAAFRQRKRLAELGEAVAKINHDLRNSLSAAQIVSEGLSQSDDPRVKRAAPRLERAIERAISLAEGTLRYGRAEPPAPNVAPVNVIPAIEEAAAEGLAGRSEIEWSLDAPGELPAAADADHVHRIVANLVRNAARAIAEQPGRKCPGKVSARAFRQNGSIIIEIADNGPGISPAVMGRLFQPFSGSGSRDGAGLGLAIARELARGMKGDLELSSNGEAGAAFTLRVPAA